MLQLNFQSQTHVILVRNLKIKKVLMESCGHNQVCTPKLVNGG